MSIKAKIISLFCVAVAMLAMTLYITLRNSGDSRSVAAKSPHANQGGATSNNLGTPEAEIAELRKRIVALEKVVSSKSRSRNVRLAQSADQNSDRELRPHTEDVVLTALELAKSRQAEFDSEAGMRSRKSLAVETTIASSLRTVIAAEQSYAPIESSQLECRKTMCKMQYRYPNRSSAEYASTMLLMKLNGTFSTSDILILPNSDGSYELLMFSQLK